MDYYEMRENALGWQKRAYRAEAELAEQVAAGVVAEHIRADGFPDGGDGTDCPNCCQSVPEPRICHCLAHWHPHRRNDDCGRFIQRQDDIDALIEASSLGTAQAKAIRDSVDDESVQRILDRVNRRRSRIPKQGRS